MTDEELETIQLIEKIIEKINNIERNVLNNKLLIIFTFALCVILIMVSKAVGN
jgi:hypothetical protein